MTKCRILPFYFLLLLAIYPNVNAQLGFPEQQRIDVKMAAEVTTASPGKTFWVAFDFTIEHPWHIYWYNPEGPEFAPKITWQLPAGCKAGDIHWPYPKRFVNSETDVSFGYGEKAVLLVPIEVDSSVSPGPMKLQASLSWLGCKEGMCTPGNADVAAEVTIAAEQKLAENARALFSKARENLPLRESTWQISATRKGSQLLLELTPPSDFSKGLSELQFFCDVPGIVDGPAEQTLEESESGYRLILSLATGQKDPLEKLSGVLVSNGWDIDRKRRALHIQEIEVQTVPSEAAPLDNDITLWGALLSAFIGGLILNIMPCVLPVISLKILGFVKEAGGDRSKIWKHGVMFTFGVLVSFWILAGFLVAFRLAGDQLGWGFQLQDPGFVLFLAALFFVMGLSLLGVFEFGTSLMGLGSQKKSGGMLGAFLSGVLATVVATPCTAPYMSTALAFTLSQPPSASFFVLTAMGVGMSSPYMLISLFPPLLKLIPKPGAWMESFKQAMGFVMLAAMIWLLSVFAKLRDINALEMVLYSLLIIATGFWALGRWGNPINSKSKRIVGSFIAILLIFLGGWLGFLQIQPKENPWKPFTPEKVATLRKSGTPVFIDFTAAWCITCQGNKIALHSDDVMNKFAELGVETIEADWTKRDDVIASWLARYNRNSVPFYILFPADPQREPIILPQLLTKGIILKELEKLAE